MSSPCFMVLSLSKFLLGQKQVLIIVGQVHHSACPFARLFYENIFKGLEFVDLKFFKTIRILGYGEKLLKKIKLKEDG